MDISDFWNFRQYFIMIKEICNQKLLNTTVVQKLCIKYIDIKYT